MPVGKYYSTDIIEFNMRCSHCPNIILVETDPKSTEYIMKEGARRIVARCVKSSSKPI